MTIHETPTIDPADELTCLGHDEDFGARGGALTPPIVQTSLFAYPDLNHLLEGLSAEHRHHVYSRGQNPTVEAVEAKLARLERGEGCKCTGSGMAAVSAVMLGLLEGGDHVLFVNNTYGPTVELARRLERFGVTHDLLLDTDPAAVGAAIKPQTRMIWLESPGTMLFRMLDVGAVAALARDRGITTVLDNSWATPLFQKPLELGVDVVVHSASKYLGGHNDVVAGAVVTDRERLERIYYEAYMLLGGPLAPMDAWLLNRGVRTLPVRMRRHHANGLALARHLHHHPRVRRVHHPALDPDLPPAATSALTGYAGLFSFELDTDRFRDVRRFVDALERFHIGVSWGGVESLVITPNRGGDMANLASQGIPPGLVRLSVGLEDPDLLAADLDRALEA